MKETPLIDDCNKLEINRLTNRRGGLTGALVAPIGMDAKGIGTRLNEHHLFCSSLRHHSLRVPASILYL